VRNSLVTLLIPPLLALGACDGDSTAPGAAGNVTVSFQPVTGASVVAGGPIVFTEIKILLKNIQFKEENSPDTADVKAGPFVVVLNLDGNLHQVAASSVKPGMYDRVRFRVHKPDESESPPDPEFREGTSGNLRYSVIVRGTFNSVPFTYKSNDNSHQDVQLAAAITVLEDGQVNVTLKVEPLSWFRLGQLWLDPANGANRATIDRLIRESFREAYRDNNRNGLPD